MEAWKLGSLRGRASGHRLPGRAWEPVNQSILRGRASGHGLPGRAWEPVNRCQLSTIPDILDFLQNFASGANILFYKSWVRLNPAT